MSSNNKKRYLILPVIAGCLWGATGIFARTLLAYGFDTTTMVFVRMAMSTVILGIGLFVVNRDLLKAKLKDLLLLAGCGITGMLGLNLCYMKAIEDLSLSLAAVLLSMAPVVVIFLAAIFFKEKLTKRKLFCTAMALIGCLMVSGMLEEGGLQWTWLGVFLGLGSAVFYGLYCIISKITMERGYNVFTIIFYSVVLSAVVLIPVADWEMTQQYLSENTVWHVIFLMMYSACTSILPYVLYTIALKHAEAGKVTLLASGGEPTAAAIFGMLLFGEFPSVISWMGLAVTIAALALVAQPEEEHIA